MMSSTNNSRANQGVSAPRGAPTTDRQQKRQYVARALTSLSSDSGGDTGSSPMRTTGLAQRMIYPNIQPNAPLTQSQKRNRRRNVQRQKQREREDATPPPRDSKENDRGGLGAPLPGETGGGTEEVIRLKLAPDIIDRRVRYINYRHITNYTESRRYMMYQYQMQGWRLYWGFLQARSLYRGGPNAATAQMFAEAMCSQFVPSNTQVVPVGAVRHHAGRQVYIRRASYPDDGRQFIPRDDPHFDWGDNMGLGWDQDMRIWTAHPEAEHIDVVRWLMRYSARIMSWHIGDFGDIAVHMPNEGFDMSLTHHVRRSTSLQVHYFMGVFKYTGIKWMLREDLAYAREMGYTGVLATRVYPRLFASLVRRNTSRHADRGLANFLDSEADRLVAEDVVVDMATYLGTIIAAHQFIAHANFERDHMCSAARPKVLLIDAQSN